jgi:hypothetical protein
MCVPVTSECADAQVDRTCWRVSVLGFVLSSYRFVIEAHTFQPAIDMSTFEALKLAYLRSTGLDEPGVLALLAFGSISGSVGATVRLTHTFAFHKFLNSL